MARSRLIRPEFFTDEKLAKLSRDSRLTFIGMWICSDDYGVVKGHPKFLKSQIFSYDPIKDSTFLGWLKELEKIRAILPFTSNNENYYYIRSFNTYQKVDHPSKQRNPSPPDNILETFAKDSRISLDETETETEVETETETETEEEVNSRAKAKSPDSSSSIILYQLFLEHNTKLPKPLAFSKERKDKCTIRLKDQNFIKNFTLAVQKAQNSPFLCGENDRGWKATFDWLITNETNIFKVLEGKYDNNTSLKREQDLVPSVSAEIAEKVRIVSERRKRRLETEGKKS